MGLLSRMEARARIDNPKVPLSAANILDALGMGQPTPAGVAVTHDRALGITAFWAGVGKIAKTIASLPLEVYEKQGETRRQAVEHPARKLLFQRPNPFMTPFTFKEIRTAHMLTWGNSYAEIERDGAGRPIGLWPLLPDRTGVEVRNGAKLYWTEVKVKGTSTRVWLAADRVLHVPGLSFDGLQGYNVIKVHRDSLGLSIAANQYGAEFFGNSGRPSGILTHPGKPDDAERQRFRDEWNQMHTGLTRVQRTAVLWGGMDWKAISVPPEEAQFLQTRELQIDEVARILDINPILLQHFTKATTWGSGVAEFLTAFGTLTIAPWLEREEDVLNYDLFREDERSRYYCKYNANALMRGDAKTQAEVLEVKRRNGVINADEWRALDEDNPLPDGQGKIYLVPLNMVPLDQIGQEPDMAPPPAAGRSRAAQEQRSIKMRDRLRDAHRAAFEDGARRYIRRDVEALTAVAKRAAEAPDPATYLERWIEEFYPGQEQYIARIMLPLVSALAAAVGAVAADEVGADPLDLEVFSAEYAANLAAREAGASRGQIRALLEIHAGQVLADALTQRASEWADTRPGKVAANEVVRVASGAARETWRAAGITQLVWRANPGACPICREMDGRTVGIRDYFAQAGDVIKGEGASPLNVEGSIGGPPLHGGCSCSISPA